MEKLHNRENLVAFDGAAHLKSLFVDAGFVDVKVIKKSVDNGDWREGLSIFEILLILAGQNPEITAASRAFLSTNRHGLPGLVESLDEFIRDENERNAFAKRAIEEFCSGKYRLTFNM